MRRFTLGLVCIVLLLGASATSCDARTATRYLSPNGNDANQGTKTAPWRTFTKSLPKLRPGDVLDARGGTYREIAKLTGGLTPGTSSARITVQAYPGERPIIQGMFWLAYPSYWTVDGINVTGDSGNPDEHMVNIYGGTGWVLKNSELWGSPGHAELLIGTGQRNNLGTYTVTGNCIHDTGVRHPFPQDSGVYIDGSSPGTKGLITRNLIYNVPNGRGLKLGPPGSTGGPSNVTVSYNTIYNSGESNVSLSRDSHDNLITRNLLVKANAGANIGSFELVGKSNVASNNDGFAASKLLDTGIVDGGGNVRVDPQFDSIGCSGFHPQASAAQGFGRYG